MIPNQRYVLVKNAMPDNTNIMALERIVHDIIICNGCPEGAFWLWHYFRYCKTNEFRYFSPAATSTAITESDQSCKHYFNDLIACGFLTKIENEDFGDNCYKFTLLPEEMTFPSWDDESEDSIPDDDPFMDLMLHPEKVHR